MLSVLLPLRYDLQSPSYRDSEGILLWQGDGVGSFHRWNHHHTQQNCCRSSSKHPVMSHSWAGVPWGHSEDPQLNRNRVRAKAVQSDRESTGCRQETLHRVLSGSLIIVFSSIFPTHHSRKVPVSTLLFSKERAFRCVLWSTAPPAGRRLQTSRSRSVVPSSLSQHLEMVLALTF